MLRLHAITASVDDEDFDGSFVQPTLIDPWVRYLKGIRPRLNPDAILPERLRCNIGYRMQLLEFECALLLLNLETRSAFPGRSTLHETISAMKMQQVAILAYTVLEGIAVHFVRVANAFRLQQSQEKKVDISTWRANLKDEVMASATAPRLTPAELYERLVDLTGWRNLDLIEPQKRLHIDELTYTSCFIPVHQNLRLILNALNPNWPPKTCLNEDLSNFIRVRGAVQTR